MNKLNKSFLQIIPKLYNRLSKITQNYQKIILLIAIFLIFIFLQPNISSRLFSFRRAYLLNQFISKVKTQEKIELREFWQFREFYNPGYFKFNPNYINPGETFRIISLEKDSESSFLSFSSKNLQSDDSLIPLNKLSDYQNKIKNLANSKNNIILYNQNSLIYKHDKDLKIIFIRPSEQMMEVNGFFDYLKEEKSLLKDKFWLNETTIKNANI